jgi:hypothetical protein
MKLSALDDRESSVVVDGSGDFLRPGLALIPFRQDRTSHCDLSKQNAYCFTILASGICCHYPRAPEMFQDRGLALETVDARETQPTALGSFWASWDTRRCRDGARK